MKAAQSNLAELEDLLPTKSPEVEAGGSASGEAAKLAGASTPPALGVGKNEEISGAVTYGKTAGVAETGDGS